MISNGQQFSSIIVKKNCTALFCKRYHGHKHTQNEQPKTSTATGKKKQVALFHFFPFGKARKSQYAFSQLLYCKYSYGSQYNGRHVILPINTFFPTPTNPSLDQPAVRPDAWLTACCERRRIFKLEARSIKKILGMMRLVTDAMEKVSTGDNRYRDVELARVILRSIVNNFTPSSTLSVGSLL